MLITYLLCYFIIYHIQILTLLLTCGGLNCQSLEFISVKYSYQKFLACLPRDLYFKNSQQREPVSYVSVGETEACPMVFIAVSDYALRAAAYHTFDICSHISAQVNQTSSSPKIFEHAQNYKYINRCLSQTLQYFCHEKNIHLHMKHHTYEIGKFMQPHKPLPFYFRRFCFSSFSGSIPLACIFSKLFYLIDFF